MALTEMTLQQSIIRYATDFDSCVLCANDYAKEHHISYNAARSKLSGHLKGQKVFKMNLHETCICSEHIQQIAQALSEGEASC